MSSRNEELRQTILIHMGVRLLFAGVLLFIAFGSLLRGGPGYEVRWFILTASIVGLFVLTIALGLILRAVPADADLRLVAAAQIAIDGALVGCLVVITGGSDSIFVFAWYLNIFSAANLLHLRGAIAASVLSGLTLLVVGLFQIGPLAPFAPEWFFPEGIASRVTPVSLMLNVGAFGAVGALAGILAERIRTVKSALESSTVDAAALRRLHAKVVSTMPVGLITTDSAGVITYANAAARSLLEAGGARVPGRHLADVAEFLVSGRLRRDGVSQEVEATVAPGVERVIGVQVVPLAEEDSRDPGALWLLADHSELQSLKDRLAHEAHLAAIGRLSAAIAHEIRNPLAAISGSVQMLSRSAASEQDARLHKIVSREIARLNTLIEQFLEYARPKEPLLVRLNLAELIAEAVELFSRDHNFDVELRVIAAEGDDPMVTADPEQLRQLLWNLLRNAAQAAGAQPEEAAEPAAGVIELRYWRERSGLPLRDSWVIAVIDSGPGFSDEAMEELFQPFFTTKHDGTGLGLATCYHIAKAHDGDLSVSARDDGLPGAQVSLRIPADLGITHA